jgi:peroxisomal 3,2-trans-enoyl-CoA isomerase
MWFCQVSVAFISAKIFSYNFFSKIFPMQSVPSFHDSVRTHLFSELEGLDPGALLTVKKLIKAGLADKNDPDATNLRESYEQAERFTTGIPRERFEKIARKEIRHKL